MSSSAIHQQSAHIVYVHGFRGDHTTFQAFPSDLHNHLLPLLPNLETWVYPTYKSSKPLSFAVKNLLIWLESLPEGKIILAGHSMGGLLVAEAATTQSSVSNRIIGVLEFDAPLLGMHPHVVISGIASLLPANKTKKGGPPTAVAEDLPDEAALNDMVNFVPHKDAFPAADTDSAFSTSSQSPSSSQVQLSPSPPSPSQSSGSRPKSPTPSFLSKTKTFLKQQANNPLVHFIQKNQDQPVTAIKRWVVEHFEFGWAMFDYGELWDRYKKLEQWQGGEWVNFWTETMGDDPPEALEEDILIMRSRSPSRRLQNEFEIAMKRASEKESKRLRDKERKDEKRRFEMEKKMAEEEAQRRDEKHHPPTPSSPPPKDVPEVVIERAATVVETPPPAINSNPHPSTPPPFNTSSPLPSRPSTPKPPSPQHFVTLPRSSKDRWLRVKIQAVKDEVEAHCGLFIRTQNLEYERFVGRVGKVVIAWITESH